MATPTRDTLTIALIGNPNTGKSTLFNALSGVRQRVGNYSGVTVEKKSGRVEIDGQDVTIIDLPGTYSLSPRSPDEMIAVDVLLGRSEDLVTPDAILCIVDASNLERNFYLLSQVLELELPTVVALNMVDIAADKGITLDIELLKSRLGIPLIATQANKRTGLNALKQALASTAQQPALSSPNPFPHEFQQEVDQLQSAWCGDRIPRYLAERLLLDAGGYLERSGLSPREGEIGVLLRAARERLSAAGCPVPAVEAMSRYKWATEMLDGVVVRPSEHKTTITDKLDDVLTHKLWGSLIFMALMVVMFQSVFYVAEPASTAIDWLNSTFGGFVQSRIPDGALRSLLTNGVIAGVGSVLVFLPQIFTLFLFIAILEDCGYMARAAYLMDKLMLRVGLSGKSFIPLQGLTGQTWLFVFRPNNNKARLTL